MFESFFTEQALQKSTPFMSDDFLKKYKNDTILITGAGGSIGSKIVEKLTEINFKNIVLLDQSEFHLFKLKKKHLSSGFNYEIADIRDKRKIEYLFQIYKPKLVIHAAAYKHVSLIENDAYELIRTNLEGTINMFTSSLKYAVSDFIFISTDKAVNPVNNMGVSKMLAELFLKSNFNNKKISTKIIRFGNVINSNGSVIPIFLDAIYNGSAIEIRNEAVERYFIYDDVVAKNILNISIHDSNSLYLLEMNSPIKIIDLANYIKRIKKSSSIITITNLSKKEKITEELLNSDESIEKTNYLDCYRIKKSTVIDKEIWKEIRKEIIDIVKNNKTFNHKVVDSKIQHIDYLIEK